MDAASHLGLERFELNHGSIATVQQLLDAVFKVGLHPVVQAHQYGERWRLLNGRSQRWVRKSSRSLRAADIRAGDLLVVDLRS